jgi:RNA-directed DNA polymerase
MLTPVKDGTDNSIGAAGQASEWSLMPWDFITKSISKLRQRIFRATREQKWNVVRSLMKLMLRSYFNLLVSVRKVTQKNKGKKTAGVDGEVALTPKARMALVRSMGCYTLWKAKPARRIYIPKAGKPGQKRPLGIPTTRNRVGQAIVKNALEPCWEAQFEGNSYGFRPGRSVHDAIEQCFSLLNKRTRRPWILDADLKSAFDELSHEHILNVLGPVPGRNLVKAWLKAGYVEADFFHTTDSGTPQGGIISPLLLNVALHGLHQALGPAYGYVRYADDFIVCASTREQIEAVQSTIEEWLKPRGLTLHPEKTRIVHISDGFNFLSFSIRQYKGKCLIKPQKDKVLSKLAELRLWLNQHKQAKAESVIGHFNQILPGWSNHYKHAVSKEAFAYVSHEIWAMLWKWCSRRHPNKGKIWIRKKYFRLHDNVKWTFHAKRGNKTIYMFDVGSVRIERHIKVRSTASPDDATLHDYWRTREARCKTHRQRTEVKKALSMAGSGARAM